MLEKVVIRFVKGRKATRELGPAWWTLMNATVKFNANNFYGKDKTFAQNGTTFILTNFKKSKS